MKTLFMLVALMMAAPAAADVTYSVTVADKYSSALAERAKTMNLMRARAAKGAARVELTTQQALQRIVDDVLEQIDAQLMASEALKPWAEKHPRAKARMCAELRLDPCPK